MDWLNNQVGPLTVQEWGLAIFALVGFFSVINWMNRRKSTAAADKLTRGKCLVCDWTGNISQYHRTCPKCGNSITRMSRTEK